MAKDNYWTNDDGLVIGFGRRDAESLRGGVVRTAGNKYEHVVEFDYSDLPEGSSDVALDGSYTRIPEGAILVDAYLEVLTAFAGGTSYDIGLDQAGGTEIDADGLWDALVLADIDAVGDRSVASAHGGTNSGALLDSGLSNDGVLIVAATGTFTAGRARIVIEYVL